MADSSTGDKTEKASAQKLKKSRQEGQVVRSRDLSTALGILISMKVFIYLLPGYLLSFRELFAMAFMPLDSKGALENAMSMAFTTSVSLLIKMIVPLFCVPLFVVLGSLIPGGWVISTKNWMPKMERLSPAKNLGRLIAPKHAFEFGLSIAKAVVLGMVLVHVSRSSLTQ